MAGETISKNMGLPIPGVGVTPGTDYADDINNSLIRIDAHDHTPGNGAPITPSGININADLLINNQNLTLARSLRFYSQSAPLAASPPDLGCLYEAGSDLYFNDGAGNQIRITASGALAGTPGSISNLTSPASATYVSGTQTFVWESDTNTSANMDAASINLRNLTSGSFALTLSPPNALTLNYTIVLPLLPTSGQKIMTIDKFGTVGAVYDVDNLSLQISSDLIGIKPLGVTGGMIADATIPATKMVPASITGTQVSTNINLPGKSVQAQGNNVVVSSVNASQSLAIIRANLSQTGIDTSGEGISAVSVSGNVYTISFTHSFSDIPVITLTGNGNTAQTLYLSAIGNASCEVVSTYAFGFSLIAIGQRA